MKALYEMDIDCGRMGNVTGLFVADKETVEQTIGKYIYFGEVLGKHSEVSGALEEADLTIKSEDQDFITKLVEIIGSNNISGYNPLNYLQEDME